MSRRLHSPELAAIEIEGMTRSAFLMRGALAAGALYGAGAVGPWVGRALAQTTSDADLEILKFALVLEEVESAFYVAARKTVSLTNDLRRLTTEFGEHEKAHAKVLRDTMSQLGGEPPDAPKVKFGLSDQASFLRVAVQLEEIGVGAYIGAAPEFTTPDLINAAGAIAQVEARHAATLRLAAGEDPAPNAFDQPLSPQEADAAVTRLLGG
jgi:rubrerythrin